jgi:protoheme ferro-lyase
MMKNCLLIILLSVSFFSCSSKQDQTNFKKYLNQDLALKGKTGVLITALGQPEQYDFTFFNNYLQQIFKAAFPWYLKPIILRDSGTVLLDPGNPMAEHEFKPAALMDCFGKVVDESGKPYADMKVQWIKPRDKGKPGHFLLDKKNGYIDIVEKSAIKVCAAYYARMPGRRVPYMVQHAALFADIKDMLAGQFPGVPVRTGWAMYPVTVKKAVEELVAEKVETIVVCDLFPVYSNLEEFSTLFPDIEHAVAGRAKVIYTPSVGNYASYRRAFVNMAKNEITKLPSGARTLLVLNRHGFPDMEGEPYHQLAPAFYDNLKNEVEYAVKADNVSVVFADTEFSGDDDDPDDKRLSSAEALEKALAGKYDAVVYVLVDFMSENTDTVFCARNEALDPIAFEYPDEVPYVDFDMPFRTELTRDGTRIVIAGAPVGPQYRPLVARGVVDALATVLEGQAWPRLY